MEFNNFKLEIVDKEICILSFNSQDTNINTVNKIAVDELYKIINLIKKDDNIKGVILNSLKKDFHYGYNLEQLLKIQDTESLFNLILKQNHSLRLLESMGKKVVSIHQGKTYSGGLEIALSSHYRIASDNPETAFAIKDLNFGLCMGMGGSQRLPRLIGISQTIDLILNKKLLTASNALDLKIINEIVEEKKLIERAKNIILSDLSPTQPWDNKKLENSYLKPFEKKNIGLFLGTIAKTHSIAKNHYPGVKTFLSCIFEGLNTNIDSGLKIESRNFVWLLNHQETRTMINTLLLNKPKNNIENSKLKDFKIILNKNYAAEGIRLLLEGISPALIENAGKRLGFSNGPLAEADNLEIKSVISQLDSSDANVTALIGLMEKKDRKGRSNKAGFYDYDTDERTKLWEGLEELVQTSKKQPVVSEIEKRLLFILINEFSNKADDYIKNIKVEEQDYFSIKDCGFPAWTGGPYSWLKNYGVKNFIKTSNQYSEKLGPRFIPSKRILRLKEIIQE